jgi:hypothetical protein
MCAHQSEMPLFSTNLEIVDGHVIHIPHLTKMSFDCLSFSGQRDIRTISKMHSRKISVVQIGWAIGYALRRQSVKRTPKTVVRRLRQSF